MKLLTSSKNVIEELKKIHIERSEDLIEYLPYRYESFEYTDENNLTDKSRLVVLAKLVSTPRLFTKGKLTIITFHVVSVSGKFYTCKVYNRPYMMNMLDLDNHFTIVGSFDLEKKEVNVINLKKGEIPLDQRLKPVYHLPSEITQANFINLMKRTLEKIDELTSELVPSRIKDKYHLLDHKLALRQIHFPKNWQEVNISLRTLKFEECLEYCFKNKLIREQNRYIEKRVNKQIDKTRINEFILSLPYKLTKDQIQAIKEIVLDIDSSKIMYRLLQGDVGTGKTIVSIVSLFANYLRGKQGVLLSPTDSLTRQHFNSIDSLLSKYGIKCDLLIGSMTNKEKQLIREKLINGEIDVLVGTHAVFSENVEYKDLGYVVIDEQHRFGVNQRNSLVKKGEAVDLLLMSATPIPRTLALSIYGDLDVSTLTTYPTTSREVITKVVDYDSKKIISLINFCIENNRQVFVVCPKINMGNSKQSSEEVYRNLEPLYGSKIALLHGKMANNDKIDILDKFRKNEINVLVSTTLIELGIDVKTAGGMIIYSANSFGLATLHQLRGRVGRNGEKAFCLLVEHFDEDEDDSRLKFLEKCHDGFEISEEDMKRRGPGDFVGIEQSGFPSFNSLNIVSDFKMFSYARDEVGKMFNDLEDVENNKYYYHVLNKIRQEENISLLD